MADFNPVAIVISLVMVALIPFIVVSSTSFIKISMVLYIVRNAIGVQQVPPNIVLHSIALFMSLYVMSPVISQVSTILHEMEKKKDVQMSEVIIKAMPPLQRFLSDHTHKRFSDMFEKMSHSIWPEEWIENYDKNSLLVLLPSFAVQELTDAFRMGFLIYLPFIVIDMVVSNVLLALGMMMMSPLTISLPVKVLLFIMMDGWARLVNGLVMSYRI